MSPSAPGDFSRITFDPAKHYNSVLMQQGRVQLDADWNEQAEIFAHRLRTVARDVIGATGAPAGSSGFAIVPRSAFHFDGKQQYLTLGAQASPLYSAVAQLRVELLIKPRPGGGGGTVLCRFDQIETERRLRFTYLLSVLSDGRLRFTQRGRDCPDLLSARPVPFGEWSRITVHHDAGCCQLAINGDIVGSLDRGIASDDGGAFFLIGLAQLKPGGPPGFAGAIRDIGLVDPSPSGGHLLGRWLFDKKGSGVVLDRSIRRNHAVLGDGSVETQPTLALDDLEVREGRYYVDGVLCENEATVSLTRQPAFPGVALPTERSNGSAYLLYLDAWERHIGPAQDPNLVEPALGGADTSSRTCTVAQVGWMPVALDGMPDDPRVGLDEWEQRLRQAKASGRIQVRRQEQAAGEVENRLYRVQVQAVPEATPGWKWSRDNGSVALPIRELTPGSVTVSLGALGGEVLPFKRGDLVEIADDRSILQRVTYPLLEVDSVDQANRSVTLSTASSPDVGSDPALNPVAIRWDGAGPIDSPVTTGWQRLERDIEVRFSGDDQYQDGDYWTFVSRTESGGIHWPLDDAREPEQRPPDGVQHHLAPLAILRFSETGFELRDCRHTFQPLSTGMVSKAGDQMHGRLEIRPNVASSSTEAALKVAGIAEADTLLGALGSPAAVATFNLAPGSVTRSKIAPDVGTVPAGSAILGAHATPPPGYESAGCSLMIPHPAPEWVVRPGLTLGERPGQLRSTTLAGKVYTFSSSGRAWVYDPDQGRLEERRPMPVPRRRFSVGSAHDRAYIVGGLDDSGHKLATLLEYDPTFDTWDTKRSMPTARCDVGLATLHGKLYVVGGLRSVAFFDVVTGRNEVYDPVTDRWSRRRPMSVARYGPMTEASRSGVFALGGRRRWFLRLFGESVSATSEEYLPGIDRWVTRRLIPVPRSHGGAVASGDAIFVVGGRSLFGWTADTSRYSPYSDAWEPLGALPIPIASPAVATVDGRLIVHTASANRDAIEVVECQVATPFHVHRKMASPQSDIEPQLVVPESTIDQLAHLELRLRGVDVGQG